MVYGSNFVKAYNSEKYRINSFMDINFIQEYIEFHLFLLIYYNGLFFKYLLFMFKLHAFWHITPNNCRINAQCSSLHSTSLELAAEPTILLAKLYCLKRLAWVKKLELLYIWILRICTTILILLMYLTLISTIQLYI